MPKHLIVASTLGQTPLRYFLGYRNDWAASEGLWTLDPWKAAWIEADEAAVEVILLGALYPHCHLQSWPLNTVGTPEPR